MKITFCRKRNKKSGQ